VPPVRIGTPDTDDVHQPGHDLFVRLRLDEMPTQRVEHRRAEPRPEAVQVQLVACSPSGAGCVEPARITEMGKRLDGQELGGSSAS
jgi:hypothetical protein